MLERILCAVFGHRYVVERVLNERARKVGCTRCGCKWAMHDPTRTFEPWDLEFEALYAPGGPLDVEYYGFACRRRAEGELIDCAKPLHHVKTGVDRLTGEIVRLAGVEYELARLRSDCVALAAWQCVYPDGLTGLTHDETGNATCRKDAELARLRALLREVRIHAPTDLLRKIEEEMAQWR